jgi:hypothetical protein
VRWWKEDVPSVAFGLATGFVWGLATAGSTVPRGFVVDRAGEQAAFVYADGGLLEVPPSVFLDQHYTTVVEVLAIYFFFIVLAGWVTWQWVRHRNAHGGPVHLMRDTDRYLVGVLVGGSAGGLLFVLSKMEALFSSAYPTLADLVVGTLFIFLPPYAALGLFFLWLRRKRSGGKPAAS